MERNLYKKATITDSMSEHISRQDIHTPEEWAEILKNQAETTKEHRHNLLKKIDIKTKKTILDVGCGTGAVTADIASVTKGHITGIDVDDKKLAFAKEVVPDHVDLLIADVLTLPFTDNTFDVVTFSVVLTHIHPQQQAVNEMARVTKKGGIVLASMEPDYDSAFQFPETTAYPIFKEFFERVGVEMRTGRKLRYLFGKAGLKTEIGLCSGLLNPLKKDSEKQVEDFLEYFKKGKKPLVEHGWTDEQIEEYKQEMVGFIRNELIFSFYPCFYAIGRK
jgi:ubiquinone/menaquinone biosynthesis C-methylase UbiE